MTQLRQIAVSSVGALALAIGVAACSHERPEDLPGSAVMEIQGDNTLNFTAPADGTAYVYDTGGDRTIWSGKVERGQSLVVDLAKDKILLDGIVVSEKSGLAVGHETRIFFDKATTGY